MLFGDIIGELGEEEFLELGEFIESSLISSLVLSELDICDGECTMTGC